MVATPPPAPPPEPLACSHTMLCEAANDLQLGVNRDGTHLESMAELLAQAAQRSRETDELCASIAEDVHRESAELQQMREELARAHGVISELERARKHDAALAGQELTRVKDALAESEKMRALEATLAQRASGSAQLLETAVTDGHAERERLRTALEAEQARSAAAEGARSAAVAELEKEKARRPNLTRP